MALWFMNNFGLFLRTNQNNPIFVLKNAHMYMFVCVNVIYTCILYTLFWIKSVYFLNYTYFKVILPFLELFILNRNDLMLSSVLWSAAAQNSSLKGKKEPPQSRALFFQRISQCSINSPGHNHQTKPEAFLTHRTSDLKCSWNLKT